MMKKLLLSLGAIATVVVIALIALIIFLPTLVDTQTFRNQLTKQVRDLTSQELSVTGELSISVFPWLGIRTGEIRLSQPPSVGLDQPVLLSVQQADVGVKFLPLLRKKIEISKIVFDSPSITYIETKNGSNSLDGFNQANESEPQSADDASSNESSSGGFEPAAIVIAGISIVNGELTVDDQALGESHRVENLAFNVGNLLGGEKESLSFSADVIAHEQDLITIEFESKAQLDLNATSLNLTDVAATVEQQTAKAKLAIAQLHADQQAVELSDITINVDTADLLDATVNPELLIRKISYDLIHQTTNNITYSIIEKNIGLNATGDIALDLANDTPLYKGHFSVDELVPTDIIDFLAIDYKAANQKVLKKLSLSSRFNGSDKGLSVNDLIVQLDQTKIDGNVAIVDFEAPRYNFSVNLDRINLDDYMPPEEIETASTHEAEENEEPLALLLPIEVFKAVYANGVFNAEQIQASGIKLQALNLTVASTDNTVKITPTASLYEGKIGGAINYRAISAERSVVDIAPTLSNVQFGDLLKDADITDQVSGRGSLDIDIQVTDDKGQQSNAGTIGFAVSDGALKNIDIQQSLYDAQDAIDRLKGKTPKTRPETGNETRFAEATGTFVLNDFLFTNEDLLVKAPAFRLNGKGDINIESQALDYFANIALVETSKGQGGKELNDLKGITIPLKIKGTFDEPKPSIDIKQLIKANSQRDVDQELAEKKQESKEKVEEKKEELLEDAKKKLLDKFFN